MVAETRAYFRELLDKNLDASHLVRSDFAMLNEKLATHYGIPGVSGSQIRRVALPPDCPRGGFLTQAAILKVTANGTTTSPVPRGAFVMARLLGQPPEPPPPNIPAVEPDVRGATTIREQLDKHRADAIVRRLPCEDGPARLRAGIVRRHRRLPRRATARIGEGDPAPRGAIDPFIGISFKLGPPVDPSGALPDGRKFSDIREFQDLLAAPSRAAAEEPRRAARDLRHRPRRRASATATQIAGIVARTQKQGGGIRTLHPRTRAERAVSDAMKTLLLPLLILRARLCRRRNRASTASPASSRRTAKPSCAP